VPGRVFENILPSPGGNVWGAAYACTQDIIDILDEHEYVHQENYIHHHVHVVIKANEAFSALTYVAGANFICNEGDPSIDDVNFILNGTKSHDLPNFYINKIANEVVFLVTIQPKTAPIAICATVRAVQKLPDLSLLTSPEKDDLIRFAARSA
jgi:cation transport regulator ChaC